MDREEYYRQRTEAAAVLAEAVVHAKAAGVDLEPLADSLCVMAAVQYAAFCGLPYGVNEQIANAMREAAAAKVDEIKEGSADDRRD